MVLLWLFILILVVQAGYALYFFSRVFQLKTATVLPVNKRQRVSVIICAKDEAENLNRNLPSILAQQYHDENGAPMYEVIVVNDASTDNTAQVLQELEQEYSHLWDVQVTADELKILKGKKFALSKGVAQASYSWLLLTDADCMPASDRWLELMVAPLSGKEIVVGYGGYKRLPGFLNAFIRLETLHTFIQYSSYALAGKPYMGVGRNMACTKNIVQKAQQSEVWNALPSGDDDLLVSSEGTAGNTAVVCDPQAFTYSYAKKTWGEWARQKQRHLSTGKYYPDRIKTLVGAYATSHADMWIFFVILLFLDHWQAALVLMAVRCVIYWVIWAVAASKVQEKNLILLFPVFDIGWLVYNFAFLPYIAWKNKQQWT